MKNILKIILVAFLAVAVVSFIQIYNRGDVQISSLNTTEGLRDLAWKESEEILSVYDDVIDLTVKAFQAIQKDSTEQNDITEQKDTTEQNDITEQKDTTKQNDISKIMIEEKSPDVEKHVEENLVQNVDEVSVAPPLNKPSLQSSMSDKEPISIPEDISEGIASLLESEQDSMMSLEDIQRHLEILNEVNASIFSLPSSMKANQEPNELWKRIVKIQCRLFPHLRKEYLPALAAAIEEDTLIDIDIPENLAVQKILKISPSSEGHKDMIITSSAFEKEDTVSLNFLERFGTTIFALRFRKIILERPDTKESIILDSTEMIDDDKIILYKSDLYKIVTFPEGVEILDCERAPES